MHFWNWNCRIYDVIFFLKRWKKFHAGFVPQHPSPLKEPIRSRRTPKQLLKPPFLYRLHERLEVVMMSLRKRASTSSLASGAALRRSTVLHGSRCPTAPSTDLSEPKSFSSTCASSEERGKLMISFSKSCCKLWEKGNGLKMRDFCTQTSQQHWFNLLDTSVGMISTPAELTCMSEMGLAPMKLMNSREKQQTEKFGCMFFFLWRFSVVPVCDDSRCCCRSPLGLRRCRCRLYTDLISSPCDPEEN